MKQGQKPLPSPGTHLGEQVLGAACLCQPFPVPEACLAFMSLLQAWWFELCRMCVGPILAFARPLAAGSAGLHRSCHGAEPITCTLGREGE